MAWVEQRKEPQVASKKDKKKGFGAFLSKMREKALGIKEGAKKWKDDFMAGKGRKYNPVVKYHKRTKDVAKATK